jgi:hypothetical protein
MWVARPLRLVEERKKSMNEREATLVTGERVLGGVAAKALA